VLWIRALNDGLLKSKGKRLPNPKAANDLNRVRDTLRAFLHNPKHYVDNIQQFQKAAPIDMKDSLLELVPEAYLDQAPPTEASVKQGIEQAVRETFAFLVKIDKAILKSELLTRPAVLASSAMKWQQFTIVQLFDLERGDFHSIADLDLGEYVTMSRISTDNGFVGFYDKPNGAKVWPAKTITVSTVTGDAFLQPVPFIVTDNVVLLTLKKEYAKLSLPCLFFVSWALNTAKWRYSYGRQCYKTKLANTGLFLPVIESGDIDTSYMEAIVRNTTYWPLVEATCTKRDF
jgi:hypothetical protein